MNTTMRMLTISECDFISGGTKQDEKNMQLLFLGFGSTILSILGCATAGAIVGGATYGTSGAATLAVLGWGIGIVAPILVVSTAAAAHESGWIDLNPIIFAA